MREKRPIYHINLENYIICSLHAKHCAFIFYDTIASVLGDFSKIVLAIRCYCNKGISIFTECTKGSTIINPQLCITPFTFKVFWQQTTHKWEPMIYDKVYENLHVLLVLNFSFICSFFPFVLMYSVLIWEHDLASSLIYRENVNCSLVWRACDPVGVTIKGYRVDLGLVRPAPHLLQRTSILSGEQPYQGAFVARCS